MIEFELTKEQRHDLYKAALYNFECLIVRCEYAFLCHVLYEEYIGGDMNKWKYSEVDEFPTYLPEFMSQKPARTFGCSWFKTGHIGNQKRIEVLKKCIELTKP